MRKFRLRHLNSYFLHKFGFHLTTLESSATLEGLLRKISSLPIEIKTIFDVGAYKGTWSKCVRRVFPEATFVLFEPNSIHNREIEKLKFRVLNILLGRKTGEKVLFFRGGQTGDSYFKEKNDLYTGKGEEVELISLRDAVSNLKLGMPDFIKLDTQGSELEILLGAGEILGKVKIVLIELPITRMNFGAPSLSEIVDYMEQQNFVPIHLSEIHIVIDILVQIDIAFLRRDLFVEIYGHDDITHRPIMPNL